MWTLRAAVRRGAWLSRLVRGRPVPRAAPPPLPPPPWPGRALAAFGTGKAGGLQGRGGGGGGRGPRAHGGTSGAGEAEEEPEDEEEEEEEEELLRREPLLPSGTQRVCLVHPEIKGGPRKPTLTRAEWQVAEAKALVHTLDHWSVVETMVVPTKAPDRKLIFGKGTLEQLTEKIRSLSEVTAVFLNVERMSMPTKKELEAAWRVQVFDRFTVVLHIFRCNARTKEARLQVALAELPLLRSNMKHDLARLDGHGGNSRYIMGSGAAASDEGKGDEDPQGPGAAAAEEAAAGPAAQAAGVPGGLGRGVHQLREDHADQGSDGRRCHAAPGPAVCHPGRHRPRGLPPVPPGRRLHGHHRLPVRAAPQPHRVLLRHPAGRGPLGRDPARAGREPPRGRAAEAQRARRPARPGAARAAAGLGAGGAQQGGPGARVPAVGAARPGRVRAPRAGPGGAEGRAGGRRAERHREAGADPPRAAGGAAAQLAARRGRGAGRAGGPRGRGGRRHRHHQRRGLRPVPEALSRMTGRSPEDAGPAGGPGGGRWANTRAPTRPAVHRGRTEGTASLLTVLPPAASPGPSCPEETRLRASCPHQEVGSCSRTAASAAPGAGGPGPTPAPRTAACTPDGGLHPGPRPAPRTEACTPDRGLHPGPRAAPRTDGCTPDRRLHPGPTPASRTEAYTPDPAAEPAQVHPVLDTPCFSERPRAECVAKETLREGVSFPGLTPKACM
ncbi:putative GTP-binding protein 6 isoform X1 [Myotis myotis]|uniref:putative GTP-binding protein 6 isoform X1 n=1 Tax=Myotis myotis TaxID=51298 RepID=UPI001748AEC1|nr:putative GTP-binding protein 6 isoform X1 [Myotis myotis]